ncbi:MAG: hypothetical protein JRG91_13435 [Deltaproteobacteria bacterium]|nr:hypothetical protein [Deltaproteobacteria bacterium]
MRLDRAICVIIALLVAAGCGGTVKNAGQPDGESDGSDDPTTEAATDAPPDGADDPAAETFDDPADEPVPDSTTHDGTVGEACTEVGDCSGVPGEDRLCLESIPMGPDGMLPFPNGYCSALCERSEECGEGGVCIPRMMTGGYCFKLCNNPGDCRTDEGYECGRLPGPGPTDVSYCVPIIG